MRFRLVGKSKCGFVSAVSSRQNKSVRFRLIRISQCGFVSAVSSHQNTKCGFFSQRRQQARLQIKSGTSRGFRSRTVLAVGWPYASKAPAVCERHHRTHQNTRRSRKACFKERSVQIVHELVCRIEEWHSDKLQPRGNRQSPRNTSIC